MRLLCAQPFWCCLQNLAVNPSTCKDLLSEDASFILIEFMNASLQNPINQRIAAQTLSNLTLALTDSMIQLSCTKRLCLCLRLCRHSLLLLLMSCVVHSVPLIDVAVGRLGGAAEVRHRQ